jgi:DNA-binding CsgD family transcriptional regulator
LCDAGLDSEELRVEALAELRHAIGFDRWCWTLADPDSLLPHGAVAEADLWPAIPYIFMLEQAGDVNAKHVLARSRYPAAILSAATGGDLARSTRWDRYARFYGVGDALSAAFRDGHGCWGFLELLRDSDDAPFALADARLVQDVGADLSGALRRAAARPGSAVSDEPLGPGVVILDEELRVASWTRPAQAWLKGFPSAALYEGVQLLPAVMYAIAGRVFSASRLPTRHQFRTAGGRWAIVDGARLEGADAGRVAMTIRAAGPGEAVELHCRAHGLTARERQLVSLVLTGLSTRQLADDLSISSYTVKDHLKAVFDKVGVRSRRELVAGILGQPDVN